MATYSTFFLCAPSQLAGAFPGWLPPLPHPVPREIRNPFTGKMVIRETREPQWPNDPPIDAIKRGFVAVEVEGIYEDYLEGRLSERVRSRPHWCAKGLTRGELIPLCLVAGIDCEIEDALYARPSVSAMILQIPPALVSKLASSDAAAMAELSQRWAAEMSTPAHTHSVSGVKLSEGWAPSGALGILEELSAVIRQRKGEEALYLLLEW